MASTAEQQYLQGAAQGFGREDDSSVVRVYLPQAPTAVHDQARPEAHGAELTPTVTPIEIAKVGVIGSDEWSSQITESLSKSGYAGQRQTSEAQILLISEENAEDFLFGQGNAAESLSPEAIIVLASLQLVPVVRSIRARLESDDRKIELVEALSLQKYGGEGRTVRDPNNSPRLKLTQSTDCVLRHRQGRGNSDSCIGLDE